MYYYLFYLFLFFSKALSKCAAVKAVSLCQQWETWCEDTGPCYTCPQGQIKSVQYVDGAQTGKRSRLDLALLETFVETNQRDL